MLSVFIWWLAAVAIGLVVMPMALWIFRNLPDRGYAFARPLGLVVVGYLFWIGGTSGLLHNTRVAIIFVMLLVGLLSAYLVRGSSGLRAGALSSSQRFSSCWR